jgi:cell shape-determining protein MreD
LFLVIYISLKEKGDFYLPLAFLCGLLLDFSTGLLPGSFAASFLFIAYTLRQVSLSLVDFGPNWKFLPGIFASSEIFIVIFLYLYNFIGLRFGQTFLPFSFKQLLLRGFWEFLYGAALLFPFWRLFEACLKIVNRFSTRGKAI